MARPIITLTTDFGDADGFVGAMKGVILGLCPEVRLVNISHGIPPGDIARAAMVLQDAAPHFPAGSIHLVVVDPGVGSDRQAMAFASPQAMFVGPNNGVFGLVWHDAIARFDETLLPAVELTESRFFREKISTTFHGRDVFAPVAAHLAAGVRLAELGPPLANLVPAPISGPQLHAGVLEAAVAAVDRFGNCITNAKHQDLTGLGALDQLHIEVGGVSFGPLRKTYSDVGPREVVAYLGSSGRLELALRDGHLRRAYGFGHGTPVHVRPKNLAL